MAEKKELKKKEKKIKVRCLARCVLGDFRICEVGKIYEISEEDFERYGDKYFEKVK